MKERRVQIEKHGIMLTVGTLRGSNSNDTCFSYAPVYLNSPDARAVSLSLPLQEETFDPDVTRNFFEGLLPEGFTRQTVAQILHHDENDYMALLSVLGRECIGAIKIIDDEVPVTSGYDRLSLEQIRKLAEEGTTKSVEIITKTHLSLTGASGKVGLYYDEKKDNWYLPFGDAPSTHIVKQSHVRLKEIVANEQLCLRTAAILGLDVPDSFVVNVGKYRDEDILFATRRFDRRFYPDGKELNGIPVPARLHQEDFAQALGIASFDKYETEKKGYLKSMFDVLRNNSSEPIADQLKLWDCVVFDFLVGNTDNHIKNVSLLYSSDLSEMRLAPLYDILSTSVYENSTRDMAFFIGSEVNLDQIQKDSFEEAAKEIGLGRSMAMQRFASLSKRFEAAIQEAAEELRARGFRSAHQLREQIMETGGISRVRKNGSFDAP